jgi:hypothetical protein
MPPKLKVRVTSKMLEVLTPPEMRLMCLMLGMPIMQSWKASPKERQTWFLENLTGFVAVDLEKQNWAMFRGPIKDYCMALQAYASGDGPLPVFNPLMEEIIDEAQPIKYEDTPVWERTDEEAEDDEKEEILEEISGVVTEAPVVEPVVPEAPKEVEPPVQEEVKVKEETSAKRFVLKKAALSNKAPKEPKTEEPAESVPTVSKEVEEVKLPAVRAVNQNYDIDAKIQVIGDLVEKLCQVVTKQQHQLEKLIEINVVQSGVLADLSARPDTVEDKVDALLKDNDLFNKAMLILLNSTVLTETPLSNLAEVEDIQFED